MIRNLCHRLLPIFLVAGYCLGQGNSSITIDAVVNAASYQQGAVAPGEIIVLFGKNFGPPALATLRLSADQRFVETSLANTRVLFDGEAAPILYAISGQVSAVVPFSVSGRTVTQVQVEYESVRSAPKATMVTATLPGVFAKDSSGSGEAAVLNQDNSVNGSNNPARRGSAITIYATGGGATNPAGVTGSIVGSDLPRTAQPVSVKLGGFPLPVSYAGGAPGFVSGVLQINATIPTDLPGGGLLTLTVDVGNRTSQPGIYVAVERMGGTAGTGPQIESRLTQLKTEINPPALPEIPNDRANIPSDWLGLVSWNIQVGGTSTDSGALRPPLVQRALARLFGGTYGLLTAQEIPSDDAADKLASMLPGGKPVWTASFFETTDTMDNGFWFRSGTTLLESRPLFVTDMAVNGRIVTDPSKAVHPPQVAQFQAGNFDFTVVTVHLTFEDGDTSASVRELRNVLDYLDWYFAQPGHDPDVMVCGDFNTPSLLSGQQGSGGITLDRVFSDDPRFQTGERRFVVTVHSPTSRRSAGSGGAPASNYDHCVVSADTLEELIQVRRVDLSILTDDPEDPEMRLTSDHFPIVGFFRTRGEGVALDGKARLKP